MLENLMIYSLSLYINSSNRNKIKSANKVRFEVLMEVNIELWSSAM
jgi:hypothetical protein